jgi:hypothetical protein
LQSTLFRYPVGVLDFQREIDERERKGDSISAWQRSKMRVVEHRVGAWSSQALVSFLCWSHPEKNKCQRGGHSSLKLSRDEKRE